MQQSLSNSKPCLVFHHLSSFVIEQLLPKLDSTDSLAKSVAAQVVLRVQPPVVQVY